MKKLSVEIWSDIVCPWCAIGKRHFEAALAVFPHRDDVRVAWRAFELDPSAPRVHAEDNVRRLARKYGRTTAEAERMMRQVAETAAKDGLEFDLLGARSGNTFDAHRILHLAGERGVQSALKERLMRAYMTERLSIGEPEVLARLASEAGLEAEESRGSAGERPIRNRSPCGGGAGAGARDQRGPVLCSRGQVCRVWRTARA